MSLSARRAWIEIAVYARAGVLASVALRKESVDRNTLRRRRLRRDRVALRKESVDRNSYRSLRKSWDAVALRKESVDRNTTARPDALVSLPSLSARRAWIEILLTRFGPISAGSLSARRAWIEIFILPVQKQ